MMCILLKKSMPKLHDRLICLSGKKIDDTDRMRYSQQEWLKSPQEMAELFMIYLKLSSNTQEIVDKVNTTISTKMMMPQFEIPASFGTEEQYRKTYSKAIYTRIRTG